MQTPNMILEFKLKEEIFGIDADLVDQILRVPPITSMPLSDDTLLGVSVLSGKVVNILDGSSLLGVSKVELDNEKARVLTIKIDGEIEGICVDEVLQMYDIQTSNLEVIDDNEAGIYGFYKREDHVTQIIDIEKLIKSHNSIVEFSPIELSGVETTNQSKELVNRSGETIRALFFKIESETFAIKLDILRELIFAPDEITPIAGSDAMGMITLRDEVLAVLDLNKILGFRSKKIDDKSRCIIIKHYENSVALLVDEVEEVKEISTDEIEPLPESFSNEFIEGIYKSNEIASILSMSFLRSLIKKYHIKNEEKNTDDENSLESNDMVEVAVFNINNEEYAFSINEVVEIIRYEELTNIPEAPEFVEGILNLRGNVIPIISLPKRLGFEQNITNKTKILVCNVYGKHIGFIVDEVNEILFVEDRYISRSTNENAVFDEVINLDNGKRVILKLRVKNLFTKEELENISLEKE